MGLLIPAEVYEAMGVTEQQYHTIALIGGIPAGLASLVGILILGYRRTTVRRLIATSSKGDWVSLFFLTIVILSGMTATFLNVNPKGFDYRTTIGPWLKGILTFRPDAPILTVFPSGLKSIYLLTWYFRRMAVYTSRPCIQCADPIFITELRDLP